MEIQKVFSDYYDTERMYSVLMSEDELRLYSELQKEFGIKEALGKYISKARNGVAKKLDQSIIRDLEKINNVGISFKSRMDDRNLKVLNKKGRSDLYKKAHEMNTAVYGFPSQLMNQASSSAARVTPEVRKSMMGKSSILSELQNNLFDAALKEESGKMKKEFHEYGLSGPDLKKSLKRSKKIARDINNSRVDDQIFHEVKAGDSLLAHELGHIGNRKEGGFIRKKIGKIANDPKLREEINFLGSGKIPFLGTTGNPIKKFIEGKAVLAEERGASKRGFKYMKKAGYSPEDIESAKKVLLDEGGASDTYKHVMNARWKSALRNKIATSNYKRKLIKDSL